MYWQCHDYLQGSRQGQLTLSYACSKALAGECLLPFIAMALYLPSYDPWKKRCIGPGRIGYMSKLEVASS